MHKSPKNLEACVAHIAGDTSSGFGF